MLALIFTSWQYPLDSYIKAESYSPLGHMPSLSVVAFAAVAVCDCWVCK